VTGPPPTRAGITLEPALAAQGLPAPGMPATGSENGWWTRQVLWWHAVFVGIVVLVGVIFALDGHSPAGFALLAALLGWYALTGARAVSRIDARLGAAYLALALPLFGGLLLISGSAGLLLYALFFQVFTMFGRMRVAVASAFGVAAVYSLAMMAAGNWAREPGSEAVVSGALELTIALLIGVFVRTVVRESERRAELIEELRTTRATLDLVQHDRGVLAERERLSHEIHDTLAQGFTSILMLAQVARAAVGTDPAKAQERLGLIETTARENLAEARVLVAALAPADLQSSSLAQAAGRLAERFEREVGSRVTLECVGEPRGLPVEHEVVLLRAMQECLSNIRKHSAATNVGLRLDHGRDSGDPTLLEITDDGRGFDTTGLPIRGYGLAGMAARVEQVGGSLEVRSRIGHGTTVRVRVP
jgi:signal transduction histidine kinase